MMGAAPPMKPIRSIEDPRYVKAMSHPLRVRILAVLDERSASPNELSSRLGATLGTTAYHVRTLERLGLIKLVDETRVRGAIEHHYRARKRPAVIGPDWQDASPVAKQAAVGASLQMLAGSAQASAAAGGFDRAGARVARTALKLDPEGMAELARACDELLERAGTIEAAAAERLAGAPGRGEAADAALALLLYEAAR
jgi:DNA-binding transcriptional ArsR family regulator